MTDLYLAKWQIMLASLYVKIETVSKRTARNAHRKAAEHNRKAGKIIATYKKKS